MSEIKAPNMNREEAREHWRAIKSGAVGLAEALTEFVDREGPQAMGYTDLSKLIQKDGGIGKSYAYDLIGGYKTRLLASKTLNSAIAENLTEGSLRPISRLPNDKIRSEALKTAFEIATEEQGPEPTLTSVHTREACKRVANLAAPKTEEPEEPKGSREDAVKAIHAAILAVKDAGGHAGLEGGLRECLKAAKAWAA